MKLVNVVTYQALADWYIVLGGEPHIVRYSWSLTVPPIAHYVYHLDDQQVQRGVQEVISSTIFDRNTDRFEWGEYHFTRHGHALTVNGTRATDMSHLGSLKTAWYIEIDGQTHIVQFARVSALGVTIGGASAGWVGMAVGKALDWLVEQVTRSSLSAVNIWFDGELTPMEPVRSQQPLVTQTRRYGHTFSVVWDRRKGPELLVDGVPLRMDVRPGEEIGLPPSSHRFEAVDDRTVEEMIEVVGVEDYPLDNSYGNKPVINTQEVAKTVSNELVLERTLQGVAEAKLDLPELLKFVSADLSAKLAGRTGQKIGEVVNRRQTITMSAAPHTRVLYTLTWKRKVRKGIYTVRSGDLDVSLPYTAFLDLTFELVSREMPKSDGQN